MADINLIIDITAAGAAVFSAGIAWKSYKEAKKSANESAKSGRIARADLLGEYFSNIDIVLNLIKEGQKRQTTHDKLATANNSVNLIKSFFAKDSEMLKCLTQVSEVLAKPYLSPNEALYGGDNKNFFEEHEKTIKDFERKKHKYLSTD